LIGHLSSDSAACSAIIAEIDRSRSSDLDSAVTAAAAPLAVHDACMPILSNMRTYDDQYLSTCHKPA
jgi:hypothetical protein